MALTKNPNVLKWVDEMIALTKPDKVVWIDGSDAQRDALREEACATGEIIKLNQELLPGCYYHRTAENDVARVEDRTFICCENEEDALPHSIVKWKAPKEAYAMVNEIAKGAYKGRTMYVIPYSMGVVGSPFSKIGIEITGQQDVYGTLDQVLDLCDLFGDAVVPVLDFPHYHSRGCGCLVEPADYVNVIDQVLPYCDGKFYARFAGVEHDGEGNELRLTPIKKGDLVFEKLGDALADMCPDGTIISSSPLLEHDAMYMRIIYERMVNKRIAKALRASKKAAAEE